MTWNANLTILAILLGSLVFGLIFQRWVLGALCRLVSKTKWQWDKIILRALGRMPLLWSVCVGLYVVSLQNALALHQVVIHKILVIVTLSTVTVVIARLAADFVNASSAKTTNVVASTSLLVNVVRIIIFVIGGIILLQNLNIAITPILTTLGVGGLAVALALEETLKNLFSGIQIIASEIVRTGDYIRLESGFEGFVTDIKARSTTINSYPDQNRIIVPNSVLASSIVVNYSLPREQMWVDVPVGVAYDSDLERVERITIDVATEVTHDICQGQPERAPLLRYQTFGDSSINFVVRMYVNRFEDQFPIQHTFIKTLHARYKAENIEIPFPIRTVYHRNATNQTAPRADD